MSAADTIEKALTRAYRMGAASVKAPDLVGHIEVEFAGFVLDTIASLGAEKAQPAPEPAQQAVELTHKAVSDFQVYMSREHRFSLSGQESAEVLRTASRLIAAGRADAQPAVCYMQRDTYEAMLATPVSSKTRWPVSRLSEWDDKSEYVPLAARAEKGGT